jgi:glutathione S-transferase
MADYPTLEALARAQEARVETRTVARAEGLGPHPFTRPELPNPPEGSVL